MVWLFYDSLTLCEKLVVTAAVCNEYEVLNEALDTLLGRAQVGGLDSLRKHKPRLIIASKLIRSH